MSNLPIDPTTHYSPELAKMKKILLLAIAAILSSAFAASAVNPAYVDMEKVFQEYYKTARADKYLREQTDTYREYAKTLAAQIDGLKDRFEDLLEASQNIVLAEEVREGKRQEAQLTLRDFENKKRQLQDYERHRKEELSKQYEKRRNTIIEEIALLVKNIAKTESYDVVFDISGKTLNGIPPFVYYDENKLITETLITELNRGHEDELRELRAEIEGEVEPLDNEPEE